MAKKKVAKKTKKKSRGFDPSVKNPLKPKEREKIRQQLNEFYGSSRIDKQLLKANKMPELDAILRQWHKMMLDTIEREEKELSDYMDIMEEDAKKIGRPKSIFNDRELRYLCSIGCTAEEIAGFFQMHKDTLYSRIKEEYGILWSAFYEQNSQGMKVSIRRQQIRNAMAGDTAMLKFLGKNYLGQKEKVDFDGEIKVNSWVDLVSNLENEEKDSEKDKKENK